MSRIESPLSRWPAPAKINLFLHVTGRRPDGYHELQTLFQVLDWGDAIRIRISKDARIRREPADYPVAEDEDLVVRAARLLQQVTGCRMGATIGVEKSVPIGAGLGGGSSDAATVLLALNRLWSCGLALPMLAELGVRLGADVPLFVHGRSAMATGIGERLEPVELGRRYYVLVFPELSIATRDVFLDPDLARDSEPISLADALSGRGHNDCEAVVTARYPAMASALESLRRWGRPRVTGTGSGIFLSMESKKQAMSAAREMKTLYNVRAVSGVDRSPLHEMLDSDGP
jgi:4-diphosphocytidyl-2-C-methyl-D-erythritol kinase